MNTSARRAVLHGPQSRPNTGALRLRTAFVLSDGANLGALQVGMLEALYERGITPDFLVGTSVGALNAAFVASRPQSSQTARELGRVWRDLQRQDVFPVSLSALVGGVCRRRDHLVSDRELRRLIRKYVEFDDLAESPIPVHLIAFDLLEARELRLSEGPAVDPVAASASIPGIFPPVAIGARRLIDGGVVNNTPARSRWATWSMSSALGVEPALRAVVARRRNRGTCDERHRATCRARLPAGRTAPARRNDRSPTSTDRSSSPPPMRLGDGASVECLDGDAKLWRSAIGRSHVLLANRPNGAILKPKPRLRACAVTHSQRPRPTLTP